MWQGWVNSILGIWLVISPFVVGADAGKWNSVVSGIIIAALSVWANAGQSSKGVSKQA
jgi:hypothetical protein